MVVATRTLEYDSQNTVAVQITGLMSMDVFREQESDFENDLKRAVSGDELMRRMTGRIHKMFEKMNVQYYKQPRFSKVFYA